MPNPNNYKYPNISGTDNSEIGKEKVKTEKPVSNYATNNVAIQEPQKQKTVDTNIYKGGKTNITTSFPLFVPERISDLTKYETDTQSDEDRVSRDANLYSFVKNSLYQIVDKRATKNKDLRMRPLAKYFNNYYQEVLKNNSPDSVNPDDPEEIVEDFFNNHLIKKGLIRIGSKPYSSENSAPYNPEGEKEFNAVGLDAFTHDYTKKGLEHKAQIDKLKREFLLEVFKPSYDDVTGFLKKQNATNKELNAVEVSQKGSDDLMRFIKNNDYKGFEVYQINEKNRKLENLGSKKLREIVENNGSYSKVVASYIGALGNGLDNISRVEHNGRIYYLRLGLDNPDMSLAQNYHTLVTDPEYTKSNLKARFDEYNDNTVTNGKKEKGFDEYDFGDISKKLIDEITTSIKYPSDYPDRSSMERFEKGVAKLPVRNELYKIYVDPRGGYSAINTRGEVVAGPETGYEDMRQLVKKIYSINPQNNSKK